MEVKKYDLERACRTLLMQDPFYGFFLLGIHKEYNDSVPTAAVVHQGINCALLVNKQFWDNLASQDQQIAILKHEISHICYKHMIMFNDFSNHEKFNIAADMEVNCTLDNLPPDCYYPSTFGFENQLGTKWYYDHIPNSETSGDSESTDSSEGGASGASSGKQVLDDHGGWKDFKDLSEAEKKLISNQIDHIAKQAAEQTQKSCGKIPGNFADYINELFKQKPRVYDWKKAFRNALGSKLDISVRPTRLRENVRFPDFVGKKRKTKSDILVCIDTSGSVSDKELCDFFSEINYICKSNVSVTIAECDTRVTKVYKYEGKFTGQITGRGGTSFKAVCDYYYENRKKYTTCVFFTDGYDSLDGCVVPNQNNMYWVITSDGSHQDYPGKTIYIPKNNN